LSLEYQIALTGMENCCVFLTTVSGVEPIGVRAHPKTDQNQAKKERTVTIDKSKVRTQDDTDEPAAIDQIEQRVAEEMERIEGKAKRQVSEGLAEEKLSRKNKK